jgi:hypothetical protein
VTHRVAFWYCTLTSHLGTELRCFIKKHRTVPVLPLALPYSSEPIVELAHDGDNPPIPPARLMLPERQEADGTDLGTKGGTSSLVAPEQRTELGVELRFLFILFISFFLSQYLSNVPI